MTGCFYIYTLAEFQYSSFLFIIDTKTTRMRVSSYYSTTVIVRWTKTNILLQTLNFDLIWKEWMTPFLLFEHRSLAEQILMLERKSISLEFNTECTTKYYCILISNVCWLWASTIYKKRDPNFHFSNSIFINYNHFNNKAYNFFY